MSEGRKPSQESVSGYPSTRPLLEQGLVYTSAGFNAQSQLASIGPSPVGPADSSPLLSGNQYASAEHERGPQGLGLQHVPTVQDYSPKEGAEGTNVAVDLCTTHDLEIPPSLLLHLMFGSGRCNSVLTKLHSQGQWFRYRLTASAPSLEAIGWSDPVVPIYLRVGTETGQEMATVEVGNFTYRPFRGHVIQDSSHGTHRKRKSSPESDALGFPTKRPSFPHLRMGRGDDMHTQYSLPLSGDAPSYAPQGDDGVTSASISSFVQSAPQLSYPSHIPLSDPTYGYSTSQALAATPEHPSSRPPSWSSAFSDTSSHHGLSPAMGTSGVSARTNLQQLAPSSGPSGPFLMRTSILQPSPRTDNRLGSGQQTGSTLNTYALYPAKAVLRIHGDLDSMAENWSPDEWAARRRIVRFHRQQSGTTIHTTFRPASQEERSSHNILISCIWWKEKGECFVTSVDIIHLLESLVAERFGTDEKNRIRRNTQGFGPLTVSKGNPESEEFFKMIMGFPAPKPRNIEKDVKVFRWKILAQALKKVIGKYSASYSSTIGPLHTPATTSGYVAERAGTVAMASASPESIAGSLTPGPYSGQMTSTSLSPRLGRPIAQQGPLGGHDLRLNVPQLSSQNITSSPRPQPFAAQPGRPSWGLGQYIDPGPGIVIQSGADAVHYGSSGGLSPAEQADILTTRSGPSSS